jgi:signal transduction histidine kinase
MERVLDNLISNALKYTPEGGEVNVALHICDKHVEITVADTGLGIPEEDIPHLFEAFYRVRKPSHKNKAGTGLGLSIVEAIVHQHNGDIHVESELGEGSSFIISIPHPS